MWEYALYGAGSRNAILSLYERIRVSENLHSRIFYAVKVRRKDSENDFVSKNVGFFTKYSIVLC